MTISKAQYLGGLYGLLIGDAVGVPYEFHQPADIPPFEQIDMQPPYGFQRAHKSVPIGTWSDDGAQALCLLASLKHCNYLDLNDLARRFINWQNVGYMAVDYQVFDIGIQTGVMLRQRREQIEAGQDLNTCHQQADHDPYGNGNGSLMRVLPLVLWSNSEANTHKITNVELVHLAHKQSWVTHPHPRSQACCALYCLWARSIIEELAYDAAWTKAGQQLRTIYKQEGWSQYLAELDYHIDPPERTATATGSGYVVDSLRSALWAQQHDNYQDVIRAAISLGRDTDTTACIAGGIAGLRFGFEGLPKIWVEQLRGQDLLDI